MINRLFFVLLLLTGCKLKVTDQQINETVRHCNLHRVREINNQLENNTGPIMGRPTQEISIEKDLLINRNDGLSIKRQKFKKILETINNKEVVQEFRDKKTGVINYDFDLGVPASIKQKFDLTWDCYDAFVEWLPFEGRFENSEFTREIKYRFVQSMHLLLFMPMITTDDYKMFASKENYPNFYNEFLIPLGGENKFELPPAFYNEYLFGYFKRNVRKLEYKDSDEYAAYYHGWGEKIELFNKFFKLTAMSGAALVVHEMLHTKYSGHKTCGEGDNKYECDDTLKKPYGASVLIMLLIAQGGFLTTMPGESTSLLTEDETVQIGYGACRRMLTKVKQLPEGMFDVPDEEVNYTDCFNAVVVWVDKLKQLKSQ